MTRAVAGVIAALPEECRSLTRRRAKRGELFALDEHCLVCVAGVGPKRAHRAALRLLDAGAQGLISWGCAGALAPHLAPGDLCLPNLILDDAGNALHVSQDWHERVCAAVRGHFVPKLDPLLTVTCLVASAADKRRLARQFGAAAVDMESAAIAMVAGEARVPFLAVRAIADPASTSLPNPLVRATDAAGEVKVGTLLRRALLEPRAWPSLLQLARHFHTALRTLSAVATQLESDFLLGSDRAA